MCFRDPIRVPRNENQVLKIRENYHRVPRIREIGSLQVHTGYLTFSLKKTLVSIKYIVSIFFKNQFNLYYFLYVLAIISFMQAITACIQNRDIFINTGSETCLPT